MEKPKQPHLPKQVQETLAHLQEAVDDFNATLAERWHAVEDAQSEFNEALWEAQEEGLAMDLSESELQEPEELTLNVDASGPDEADADDEGLEDED